MLEYCYCVCVCMNADATSQHRDQVCPNLCQSVAVYFAPNVQVLSMVVDSRLHTRYTRLHVATML